MKHVSIESGIIYQAQDGRFIVFRQQHTHIGYKTVISFTDDMSEAAFTKGGIYGDKQVVNLLKAHNAVAVPVERSVGIRKIRRTDLDEK